jgi:hypothetical protein
MNCYILYDIFEFRHNGTKYVEGFNIMNDSYFSNLNLKMTSICQIYKKTRGPMGANITTFDLKIPFCYSKFPILFDITKACRCPPDYDWSGYEFATYTIYPDSRGCITVGQILDTIIQNNLINKEIVENDPEIAPIQEYIYIEKIGLKNGNPQHLIIEHYGN